MPRQTEYRRGVEAWTRIGETDLATGGIEWRPPTSGSYQFRSRKTDALGEHGPYSYSNRVEVALRHPDIVKDLPAGKDCPPADEGEYLQGWSLPDGSRRWIRRPIFGPIPDQSTITEKGVAGVIWGIDNITLVHNNGVYQQYERTQADREGAWNLSDVFSRDGSTDIYVDLVRYRSSDRQFAVRFRTGSSNTNLSADLGDLGLAFRFDDGSIAFADVRSGTLYTGNADASQMAVLAAKFKGANVADVDVRAYRKDERCSGDELNPWVEIQAAGGRYIELVIYTKVTRGTAAPAAPTAASYDFDTAVLTGGGVWSLTPPAVEDDEVAYARIGTVSSTAPGSIVWSTARVWTAGVELDAIYRRSVTKPNRPANSATQVPTGWSPSVAATTGNVTLWLVNQHRTGESAVWQRGEVLQAEGTDGEAKRVETIYGAHTEDTLTSAQQPLDSWTFEQVRRGSPITRSGVVWASNLTDAGFSKDKEYGYVARREVPNDASRGDSVDDVWDVNLEAHWGLGAPAGLLTRFIYDDIGTVSGDGKYQFYDGGSTTARSGTALNGDWSRIKAADYLEIGDTEKDGWPCLELGDLTTDDFLVYEPSSSQWVAFDISSVTEITGGWRFGISKTEVSDGGGANISTAGGNNADFYLSVPRRQMPQPLRGAAAYNASRRQPPTNRSGYFDFHSASPPSTANDLNQLSHAVKQAIVMQIYEDDEHGNLFDSLAALVDGQYIAIAVLDTPYWVAWKVTSVSESNGLYTIGLELYSYATSLRGPDIVRYGTAADVEFYVTPFVPASADTLGLKLRPIDDVQEGTTSVPYIADVYGTALANATPSLRANIGRAGPGNLPSGYRVSNPVWNSATRTASGNITLPSSITANERLFVGVQARVAGVDAIGRDNEFVEHVEGAATSGKLPTLTDFTMRAGAERGSVVFSPGALHASATSWEYNVATSASALADDIRAGRGWVSVPRGTTTATYTARANRTYYGTVRQVSTDSAWNTSDAAPTKNATTRDTTALAAPTATAGSNAVGAVQVNWSAYPTGANGVAIEYKKSSTSSWVGATRVNVIGSVQTRTITGLDQGARYDFRVAFTPADALHLQSDWDEVDDVRVRLKFPAPSFTLGNARQALDPPNHFLATVTPTLHSLANRYRVAQGTTADPSQWSSADVTTHRSSERSTTVTGIRGRTTYVRLMQYRFGTDPTYGDSEWSAVQSVTLS